MTKLEQMKELIAKIQTDAALYMELTAILQSENPDDTAKADKWLADNGYGFTVKELNEHLEEGIPLAEDQLDAVAGGAGSPYDKINQSVENLKDLGWAKGNINTHNIDQFRWDMWSVCSSQS